MGKPMKEEIKYKIPKGLYKCPECGEYRGEVREGNLNQETNDDFLLESLKRVSLNRAEQNGEDASKIAANIKKMKDDLALFRKSQQQSERIITVSCLCDGVLCPKCKKKIILKILLCCISGITFAPILRQQKNIQR